MQRSVYLKDPAATINPRKNDNIDNHLISIMAPSIAEIQQPKAEASPITVPVTKSVAEATEEKPQIKRTIDLEGGTTTAAV